MYNERKKYIQKRVFETFKVHADQVLQGTGTTNTGNTARTCFKDPRKFAECLEIDPEIVERVAYVILAFKQKAMVDQQKLKEYATQTCKLIFEKYPWAEITPSLHKLLIHGVDIQENLDLPVSFYAEDASESGHKYYRNNATSHARQTSRKDRLKDVFNRATYCSDPLISNIYQQKRQKYNKNPDLPPGFVLLFG